MVLKSNFANAKSTPIVLFFLKTPKMCCVCFADVEQRRNKLYQVPSSKRVTGYASARRFRASSNVDAQKTD